jgi:hypothetical protein
MELHEATLGDIAERLHELLHADRATTAGDDLLKAAHDWEAIGRESVNLYLLAKTLKEAPATVRKAANAATRIPELIARTNESLRILRQRTVALGLENEVRLAPEPTGKSLEPGQDPVTLKGPDQEGGPRVREEGGGAKNGPKKSDTGEQEAILVANKKGKKGQVREEEELRGAEHDKGKRKSTQHDHQVGQSRKKADQEAADERSSEATSIAQRRRQNQVLEEIRRAAKNLPDKIQDFHRDTRKPLDVRLADLKKRLLEANSPTNVDNLLKDVGLTEKQLIEYLDNNGMLPPSE